MSVPELIRFSSDTALASGAASKWASELQAAGANRYCLALSGGRIASRMFTAAAQIFRERHLPLTHLEFFFADERCVPPTHPESNFALAQAALFAPIDLPASKVHRIRGELSPDVAASQAEAELSQLVAPNQEGQPVLDLILLGMGEDGHVASLFPQESEELLYSKRVYRAVTAPKPPPLRVTISYAAIQAARKVWVIASGEGKSAALRASLGSRADTPLGRLLQLRPKTTILTDIPG